MNSLGKNATYPELQELDYPALLNAIDVNKGVSLKAFRQIE